MCTTPSNPVVASADPHLALSLAFALCGLFAAGSALALSSDRDKDLEVRANYNQLVTTTPSHALFRTNVRIEQGSLKASGDEARVYDAAGGSDDGRRIVLTGTPAQLDAAAEIKLRAWSVSFARCCHNRRRMDSRYSGLEIHCRQSA